MRSSPVRQKHRNFGTTRSFCSDLMSFRQSGSALIWIKSDRDCMPTASQARRAARLNYGNGLRARRLQCGIREALGGRRRWCVGGLDALLAIPRLAGRAPRGPATGRSRVGASTRPHARSVPLFLVLAIHQINSRNRDRILLSIKNSNVGSSFESWLRSVFRRLGFTP
jgi:hypothetical protein